MLLLKMKSIRLFIFLFLIFCACSRDVHEPEVNTSGVEVVLKTNKVSSTKGFALGDNLSVLIFGNHQGNYRCFKKDKGNWQWDAQHRIFVKKLLVPTGAYRFLFTQNILKTPSLEVTKLQGTFLPGSLGSLMSDCYFGLPTQTSGGNLVLGNSSDELFLDEKVAVNSIYPWEKEFDFSTVNEHESINRNLTRIVGRIDFIVRRAVETEGGYDLMDEGASEDAAFDNALSKIKTIDVSVTNVGSRFYLDGFRSSHPADYSFTLTKGANKEYSFSKFSGKLDFQNEKDEYMKFEKSAYCCGPFLFPTIENQESELKIVINYELLNGQHIPSKNITQRIKVERNSVNLVILWLLNEKTGLNVNVDIVDEPLRFGDSNAIGDGGIWE